MSQLTSKQWILIQQRITPYLFLLPALIILILTVFWPAIQAFYLSFTSYENIGDPPQWIGFKNFLRLSKDPVFLANLTKHIYLSNWGCANFSIFTLSFSHFSQSKIARNELV